MNAAEPDQILEDDARLQLNDDGSLRHLLTLKGLDRSLLVDILDALGIQRIFIPNLKTFIHTQ